MSSLVCQASWVARVAAPSSLPRRLTSSSIATRHAVVHRIAPSQVQKRSTANLFTVYAAQADNTPDAAADTHSENIFAFSFNWAAKVVHDAICLVQRLWILLQRIRVASQTIREQTERQRLVAQVQQQNSQVIEIIKSPFETLAKGAAAHLTKTLTDASGTMDAKWKALETTTSSAMNNLFDATQSYIDADADTSSGSSDRNRESTASVMEQEELLKAQVFAQVMAELSGKGDKPRFAY